MLLSEILKISNKLKYNNINESFNSNIIRNIILKINNYSILDMYRGVDVLDLKFNHRRFIYEPYKQGKISDALLVDIMNNADLLQKYTGQIKTLGKQPDSSFIKRLNNYLNINYNAPIDISKISDQDITEVYELADAKTKRYKQGVQFWVNTDNEIRAITYNNKIFCLIYKMYEHSSLVQQNKNYKGNYSLQECKDILNSLDTDEKLYDDFIKHAYNIYPRYNIIYEDNKIKKELSCLALSINKLIEYFNENREYIKIYCINKEAMDTNNIKHKMLSRQEYREFMYTVKNYLQIQRRRYKELVQNDKNSKLANSKENIVIDLLKEYMDILTDLFAAQLDNKSEDKLILGSVSVTFEMYQLALRRDGLKDFIWYQKPYNRKSVGYYVSYIHTPQDLIILSTLFIQSCIEKLNDIIRLYSDIENLEGDNLTYGLQRLKHNINSFNKYIKNHTIYDQLVYKLYKYYPTIYSEMTNIRNKEL